MTVVLSVDPGREKCGVAVFSFAEKVLFQTIVPTGDIVPEIRRLTERFSPECLVMGSGTYSKQLRKVFSGAFPGTELHLVDEKHSTEEARRKYFERHPPRGWRRLLPLGLQVPPEPYDDFAAVLLAERYMEQCGGSVEIDGGRSRRQGK